MKLRILLDRALEDIDILEEYYVEQYDSTVRYVTKELEKYKYGLAIYKFLCGRYHGEDRAECLRKDEEDFLDSEIEIVEEDKDNRTVQYKLKDEKKFIQYELNPQLAKEKTVFLREQPLILNNSVLIMLLIKYENAISTLYEALLRTFPDAYLKDRSITYSELVSINSDIEEIKAAFIENEIDEFMRKPLKDWYTTFEQKHKIQFRFGNEYEQFKEIYYRRNIVVHNRGKANGSYINGVDEQYKCENGKRLDPSFEYLESAFDCTRIVLLETFWGMAKLEEDIDAFVDKLFLIGYDYLLKGKWNVCKYIFSSLMHFDEQSEADVWCDKVNYYVACKNLDGIESIKSDIEKMDVSLMKPRMAIARPALLDDYAKVSEILESIIGDDISVSEIKSWPLLLQYRNSDEYKAFTHNHMESFEIKTCSTDEIQCLSEQNNDEIII